MSLFGPYIHENKSKKKYWLHSTKKGKTTLYFFSKDPRGALNAIPGGYMVTENPMTGFPFLKKKGFKKTADKEVVGDK